VIARDGTGGSSAGRMRNYKKYEQKAVLKGYKKIELLQFQEYERIRKDEGVCEIGGRYGRKKFRNLSINGKIRPGSSMVTRVYINCKKDSK
jgi:hypothetical protein